MAKTAFPQTAWLLTGGNMGDRLRNLTSANELINQHCGEVIFASSIYETEAWGKTDQPSFLNQVLQIQTGLEPKQLLKKILSIEKKLGRFRKEKNGPRTIDIDILLFDDAIIKEPSLEVPHPRMQDRRFALTPLAEIAPRLLHPLYKKTISQLLADCTDPLEVSIYRG